MGLKKIIQTTLFSGKIVMRTWVIPLSYLLIHSYFIYIFYIYRYDTFSPPTALTSSSQLVIVGMLAYLLLGIWIVRIENTSSMEELSSIIQNGHSMMFIGKCLVGIIFILLGQFIIFVSYLVFFYGQPIIEFSYFIAVNSYISLYWSGSFLIAYLIGMLLASLIKGKFIYPVSIVVYCLLIPINYVFLESINRFIKVPLDKWLNLGEPNPHTVYHALYGFSLESFHIWKKLFLLTMLLSIFLVLFIKKGFIRISKKLLLLMIVFLLIITSTALEISKEKQLLNDDSTSLIDYYRKYKPDNINQKQYLELENVKIFLEPREQLQLNVEIEIVNVGEERLSKLFFTLFHEFEVNKIETNGEKLNFLQNGDMVEIQLNHELEKGQRVSLSFDYDGLQTNLYFGNQQAVYLPSHFPWIPSINVAPAFDIVSNQNGLHRISHKYLKETKYQLTINYNNKIYTNLDKQGGNTWSGYSSSGVTVMSGMLNEKKYEDMTFIYPVTWEDAIHGFGKFEAYINRVYGDLSNGFTTLAVEKPKNIYFLPTTNISDSLIGESSFVDHGSLIIGIPIYVEPNRDYFNYFLAELTYELVPAYTTKDLAYEKQQYEFNSLFNHVYAQLINKQLSLDDDSDYLESFIEHKLTISSKVDSVLEELRAWLKTDEAYNSHHPVYEEWYNLVREGKGWDELNTLLKKHISM